MDAFSYLSVLLSVILGLAIQQVLQGYRALALNRRRVTLFWPSLAWSAMILVMVAQHWWASFDLTTRTEWSFADFAAILIQTASIYGVVAPDQRIYEGSHYLGRVINTPAVYSASKAAVIGLTKYLASYWGAHGIRVNTLTPGGVESGQNDVFSRKYSARVPMGRMAQADEMQSALLFLASDASSYMTGQNLIIDGGLTCW